MHGVPHRLGQEEAFTLVELLVAMVVGMLVVIAAFTIVEVSIRSSQGVVDRVDATQRGRTGMDQVVQQLRAVACPSVGALSVVAAGPTSITFFADLDNDEVFDPAQRRIRASTAASPYDLIGDSNPANPVTIVESAEPVSASRPLFEYQVPSPDGLTMVPLSTTANVSTADLPQIARIDIAFATRPTSLSNQTFTTVPIESSVYPRRGRSGQTQAVPTFGC